MPAQLPLPSRLLAMLLGSAVVLALLKSILSSGVMPMLFPLVTTVLSITALVLLGATREAVASCMRVGFHVGLFAFYLSLPLFMPEQITPYVHDDLHVQAGVVLMLTLIGFELAYWVKWMAQNLRQEKAREFVITGRQCRWLVIFIPLGISMWLLTIWDMAGSVGMSVFTAMLSMRAISSMELIDTAPRLTFWHGAFQSGLFLAASSAFVLATISGKVSKTQSFTAWFALFLCAAAGFLTGARSIFLFVFVPLALACWTVLSRPTVGKTLRRLLIAVLVALLAVVWGAMSELRDAGVLGYEGGLETVDPTLHVKGAFAIYSSLIMIVDYFPDVLPYEHGRSLVALVVGWIPRVVWPDKPYPFSIVANTILGESLESRAASIAVGVPAEGYGNFGFLGAMIWGALSGMACRQGDDYCARLPSLHPLRNLIPLLAGVWVAMIVRGGVPEMFYTGVFIMLFPVSLAKLLDSRQKAPVVRKHVLQAVSQGLGTRRNSNR